jgi:NADPH:quinone reductase-like Zn-dependent oxidoreductase
VIVPERALVASPKCLSDLETATLPCAAVTAWHALFVRAPLEPDDRVLIQGTGGVALFALQFAHVADVRCIVLSSSDDKLKRARKLGASDLINYRDTPDWHLAVQEITQGEGATHILELGGEDTYERSLQCLAPNGTIAQIGVLTGFDLKPNLLPLSRLNANIGGIQAGSREYFEGMNRFIEEHRITPVVVNLPSTRLLRRLRIWPSNVILVSWSSMSPGTRTACSGALALGKPVRTTARTGSGGNKVVRPCRAAEDPNQNRRCQLAVA